MAGGKSKVSRRSEREKLLGAISEAGVEIVHTNSESSVRPHGHNVQHMNRIEQLRSSHRASFLLEVPLLLRALDCQTPSEPSTPHNVQQDQPIVDELSDVVHVVSIKSFNTLTVITVVEGHELVTLIDTGSAVCCVDAAYVTHLQKTPVAGLHLRAANNTALAVIGQVEADVVIGGVHLQVPMIVVDSLSTPCILGHNFNVAHHISIDYEQRNIHFKGNDDSVIHVPFFSNQCTSASQSIMPGIVPDIFGIDIFDESPTSVEVFLNEEIRLQPGETKITTVQIADMNSNVGLLEPHATLFHIHSVLIPRLVFDNSLHLTIPVSNVSNVPQILYYNTAIGCIESVNTVFDMDKGDQLNVAAVDVVEPMPESVERTFNINPELDATQHDKLITLLHQYESQFAWSLDQMGTCNIGECTLAVTDDKVVHRSPYRVSAAERATIKQQVSDMLARDVIRPSRSEFASPVVLVKKKNGSWRFCVDYRGVNKILRSDQYPLPLISDLLDSMNGCRLFSSLDLYSGFWQLKLAEESKHITAFTCCEGLYEFNVLPFGLKISNSEFQRFVDKILAGLKWSHALVYLDDILLATPDFETHLERLATVFDRFKESGVTMNPAKCSFAQSEIKVLGHMVNALGISPDNEKVQSVLALKTPRKLRDVRSFLGMASFFRRFVKNFSLISKPLSDLTKKNVKFVWGESQEKAFRALQNALVTAPVLRHFSETADIEIHTDASDYGIGAVIMQRADDALHPVAYASRRLNTAEEKYNTTLKECLGIIFAIKTFRSYIWGRPFVIYVDHHSLCFLNRNRDMDSMIARWSILLQEFNYSIKHIPGRINCAPDCLSRYPIDTPVSKHEGNDDFELMTLAIASEDIAKLQREDAVIGEIIQAMSNPDQATSRVRRQTRSYIMDTDILYRKNCFTASGNNLLVVPDKLKHEICHSMHDDALSGGHLGFARTYGKMRDRYYWDGMSKSVENYVKSCDACQRRKHPKQKPPGLLQPIQVTKPWAKVAIDLLGPFVVSESGNTFIVVATDCMTKYAETAALPAANAKHVAKFIVNIICRHGAIAELLSDRGNVFRSELVTEITAGIGVQSRFSTAYHPQSQGLVERFNGTLATMLSCYVKDNQRDWCAYLQFVTFAYNTSRQETTKQDPFYLTYGRQATLPIDVALPPARMKNYEAATAITKLAEARQIVLQQIEQAQAKQKKRYDERHRPVTYDVGQRVLVFVHPGDAAVRG